MLRIFIFIYLFIYYLLLKKPLISLKSFQRQSAVGCIETARLFAWPRVAMRSRKETCQNLRLKERGRCVVSQDRWHMSECPLEGTEGSGPGCCIDKYIIAAPYLRTRAGSSSVSCKQISALSSWMRGEMSNRPVFCTSRTSVHSHIPVWLLRTACGISPQLIQS